jgi:hypothetical protein
MRGEHGECGIVRFFAGVPVMKTVLAKPPCIVVSDKMILTKNVFWGVRGTGTEIRHAPENYRAVHILT